MGIEERVDAEAFPERSRPAQTPRLTSPHLSQQGEDGVVRAGPGARGQQSEVADVVPVAVGHVVGQGGQEVSRGVAGHDPSLGPRVFRHEPDFATVDMPEPVLGNRGTAGIAARVAEELPLTLEPLEVDIPPAFVLLAQQFGHLPGSQVGLKHAPEIRFPEIGDDGIAPHRHQRLAVERRLPPGRAVGIEPAFGDEHMQVAIEVEVAAKGMRDDHHHQSHAVGPAGPLLDDLGPQDRQVMEQVAVVLEDWPEHVRHREGDMGVGDIGQLSPLLALPQCRGPVAATRAGAGLARMVDHPPLMGGGEHLGAQRGGAAVQDLGERFAHSRPSLGAFPVGPPECQDTLERRHGRARHTPGSLSRCSYRSRVTTSAGPGRSTTSSVACANPPRGGPASRAANCSIVRTLSCSSLWF